MGDIKISALPAGGAVSGTDLTAVVQGGTTVKITDAQRATFMQTAMALIKLSGLNIQLNADGSAQFAGVKIIFNADGSCSFANANAAFAADGALDLPLIHLLADGSAQFANGAFTIASDGETNLGGGATTLRADGSADFAGGSFNIFPDGSVNVNVTGYSFGGTQVVTAQQPAVPDSNADLIELTGKFNDLLSSLRTHGLIAP